MYLALYRKWRPKLFDDVVAQDHITATLRNEVKFNKIAHAYLFTGPRGTGKTSCARIFSKALNCLNSVDGEPCCECEVCKGIDNGTILDVVELDGASNNNVDNVRMLKDEAGYVPSCCKFKIYIIDEVHMLSASAFNALLKIMEEPPKHVIFILATTEVNKVLETIISRCQRFDFRRISSSDVEQNLIRISKLENINLTVEAAKKIALLAGGSMRDAVSFLDECFAVDSTITLDLVNKIFGFVDDIKILNLFEAVVESKRSEALRIIDEVYESGKDLQGFCSEFVEFCREIMLCAVCEKQVFDVFSERVSDKILYFSKKFNLNLITELLNEGFNCFESLKSTLNKKLRFELFILSLCLKFEDVNGIMVSSLGNNKPNGSVISSSISSSKTSDSGFSCSINEAESNSDNISKVVLKSSDLLSNSEVKLEPLSSWPEILDDLKVELKNEMLSGFLADSTAYVNKDRLYINFKSPVVSRKVLERSADISQIIKRRTGQQYRIFVKKSEAKVDSENLVDSNLNRFLDVAKNLKIDVDEKK